MPVQLFKMLIELFNKRMDFLFLVGKSELSWKWISAPLKERLQKKENSEAPLLTVCCCWNSVDCGSDCHLFYLLVSSAMQVKDSDLKDEANETSPAGKHKGKSHKTDPGCNVNFFVLFNVFAMVSIFQYWSKMLCWTRATTFVVKGCYGIKGSSHWRPRKSEKFWKAKVCTAIFYFRSHHLNLTCHMFYGSNLPPLSEAHSWFPSNYFISSVPFCR